ncbi:MAG: hypothetical protein Q7S58_01770 [Candidatus Binatus sp.]|nr:hypothetical protein [Candidatus Binatus sp.]
MGFFQKLRSSALSRTSLLEELAVLTGHNHGLAERLRRHAEMCKFSNLRQGVAALAESEAAHFKTLNSILSDNNVWAKLPEAPLHDGSSNWARLGGDLEVLGSLAAELRLAAVKWESIDEAIAEVIRRISNEDDEHESALRKLALKCDPQALD